MNRKYGVLVSLPLTLAISADALAATGSAMAYPSKPVRLIVPFPPGGGSDVVARALQRWLTEELGRQLIIDNRGGAGGVLGAELAANAMPDGYTLLLGAIGTHALNPALQKRLPYDPISDFVAISNVALAPLLLAVHPGVQARNVRELIALAKANPGVLNYSSGGPGSSPHLAAELLKMQAGVNIVHIAYKGGGPALTDLIAGQVQMMFGSTPSTLPHVRANKIRALGISSTTRSPAAPDIPTIAESGLPKYDVTIWYGLFAPANTPSRIVEIVNERAVKALKGGEVNVFFSREGLTPAPSTPKEFAVFVKAELEKYKTVVRAGQISLD